MSRWVQVQSAFIYPKVTKFEKRTIIKEYESKTKFIVKFTQSIFYAKKRLCHHDRDALTARFHSV